MKAASKRLVTLLASLGMLVASIFVYSLLLQPAYQYVNGLRGDLASHREAFEDQKKVTEQVKKLLAEAQSLSNLKDSISRAIPGSEDYPGVVSQLSGLANTSQLRLESVSMNPLKGGGGGSDLPAHSILQITIGASGSYQAVKDFLSSIEKNIRIMDPVSISMSPPSGANQNLTYVIILNSYYQSL